MSEERWKAIKLDNLDYTGLYEVSNLGRIRSLVREVEYSDNRVCKFKSRLLKIFKNSTGTFHVSLSKDGKIRKIKVARLVWKMFKRKPVPTFIRFKDGDPTNNSATNLIKGSRY